MEYNGLSPDAESIGSREVPDRNPDIKRKLEEDAAAGRPRWHEDKRMLKEEAYWHPDGYYVWLRPDSARSYSERRSKGSTDTNGAQKAHFNVYYEKDDSTIEETDQHHTFDEED